MPALLFSVGDFIACASLIGDIIRALKDSTGSEAEFQALSQTLLSLSQALTISYVACFQWEATEIPSRQKQYYETIIDGMGKVRQQCIKLLQEFLDKAQPYSDVFIEKRGNRIKRNWKKITWLFKKDDVKNLRDELQFHLQALQQFTNALFQTQLSANTEIFSTGMGAMLMSVRELKENVTKLSSVVQESSRRIPAGLGYAWGTPPTLTENLLHDILSIMYRGLPGHRKIARREYTIADEDHGGALINLAKWSSSIHPGMQISLNFILRVEKSWKTEFCPRCNERTIGPILPGRRKVCYKCQLTFALFEKEKFVEPNRLVELEDGEENDTKGAETIIEPLREPYSNIHQSFKDRKGNFHTKEDYYFSRVHYHHEVLKPLSVDPADPGDQSYPNLEIEKLPPLHKAAANGDLEAIKSLLDAGESVDLPLAFDAILLASDGLPFKFKGCSPLHMASWFAKTRAIRILVDYGANILARDAELREVLHYAIYDTNHESIAVLLELRGNVNARDKWGKTPLHEACLAGSPLLISLLLEKGADIATNDISGDTPVLYASCEGKSDIIKILCEYGADLNDRDKNKRSPLHLAACFGHEQTVTTLLEYGAEICSKDKDGCTPIHYAASQGHKNILETFLVSRSESKDLGIKGTSVEEPDNYGDTPLHFASAHGHLSCMQLLLEYGRETENACYENPNNYGNTPLHLASAEGHLSCVQLLLEYGQVSKKTSFREINNNGDTPLHFASAHGHLSCVQLLLEYSRDTKKPCFEVPNNYGNTLLHLASAGGNLSCVQLLLEYGQESKVCFEVPNNYGDKPLHQASAHGHFSCVQLLLDYRVDVNLKTRKGLTALHFACEQAQLRLVQLLIQKGAELSARTDDGWTPFHFAASQSHDEITLDLLAHGADPSVQTTFGSTALHLASLGGHPSTVKILLRHSVDLNARNSYEESAIHLGVASRSEEVVRSLLDAGCDPSLKDKYGQTAIEDAHSLGLSGMTELLAKHMMTDGETLSELFARLGIKIEAGEDPKSEAVSKGTEDDGDWEDIESDSESSK